MIPLIETGGSPHEIGHDVGVGARTLWACAGNPCRGDWREVRL